MQFLVEFEVNIGCGTAESEVLDHATVIGSYCANSQTQLDDLLGALPLANCMWISITPLEPGACTDCQIRGVRHGSPEVQARLGRRKNLDPSEYTFHTSTRIETAARELDWLSKGVFIRVAGRQAGGVLYETGVEA